MLSISKFVKKKIFNYYLINTQYVNKLIQVQISSLKSRGKSWAAVHLPGMNKDMSLTLSTRETVHYTPQHFQHMAKGTKENCGKQTEIQT